MKKIIKWTTVLLGGIICLTLLAGFVLYPIGKKKLRRTYKNIPVGSLNIPTDAAAIARGKHISIIWACTKCHGENLSGKIFTKDPIGESIPTWGSLPAPNLTSGKGGIGRFYTDRDWVLAIRHGIKPNNRPVIFMNFSTMSDQDLADLIAFLKQIPSVDTDSPAIRYGPIIPIALALGIFPPVAEKMDHQEAHVQHPLPAATVEYGRYLSAICAECHGKSIGNSMKKWKQEDFIQTFRAGILPNGKQFGKTMSSKTFSEMNDLELSALWLYFHK